MRLSHIKLSGFKSFVDHTTIEIRGNRVAIVGPNGCGKSNVIDAVRWVLGESSAKHLRGESMQDVIFNGSTKRKSVSRATVELVFDNSNKGLTGLWNTYDEVAIKRLISRSGDSVYYINNQVVRRRDITELFLGTGVGSKGYAVIEQGMISRIIESKPEELRLFLEEAAGVSKYREKRKEAVTRLQDTRDNLIRLEDIQDQLIKQIEVLQVQAADARRYQELQTELKANQLTTILLKMDKASGALVEIDTQIAGSEKELVGLTDNLAIEEHGLAENLANQALQESKLHEITMEFNSQRTQLARFEERRAHHHELIQRVVKDDRDLLMQHDELNLQIEDLNLQITELQESITANTLIIEESQLLKQDMADSFSEIEQKYNDANKIVANMAQQTLQAKHDLELLNNTREHKKSQYTNLSNRQKKQEQEIHGLDFNQGYFALQEQIEMLGIEIEQIEQQLVANSSQLKEYKHNHQQKMQQLTQIQNEQISVNSKIATLDELVAVATDNKDLEQVIDCGENKEYLYQALTVTPGYEVAVEVALNNILSAIVIEDITQIKQVPDGLLSLWIGSNVDLRKLPDLSDSLTNFVKVKSDKFNAIYSFLNNYIVVADCNQALQLLPGLLLNQKLVTCDGHLFGANYAVFNANTTNSHMLEYQSQLQQLNHTADELAIKFNVIDEELIKAQSQMEEATTRINHAELIAKEKQQLRHKLQLEFTTHEQIYIQTKNHQEKIQQELAVLGQEMLYLQDELTEIELKVQEQQDVVNNLSVKTEDINLGKLEYETTYNLAKTRLSEIDNQINQKIIDNQLVGQKITILNKNLEDKHTQANLLIEKRIKLAQDMTDLEQEQQINPLEELAGQINDLAISIEEQNKELSLLNNKTAASRNAIGKLHKNKESIQEKLNQLRLKEQEQLLFLHNQQEQLAGLAISDYNKETILADNKYNLQELQGNVNRLQQQLEELGLVNLKAIEDLNEITLKNSALLEQVVDLTDGMTQLESAIAQIDQETRLLLDNTYTKVCESFAVYFKTLFGGGSASLELTDSDILNSGVQIFVQPPGKKNSSIHLLSGGEKALTAVSLIFAFFNLNPAPFCILDEVDAPLDDANTSRFCNLVQELSANVQFVFISHNRLTMEMADQLVGVTMQEQGVSTTVSVNLTEAVANAS